MSRAVASALRLAGYRIAAAALTATAIMIGSAGCATPVDASARLWHRGQLTIATDGTTGVYYQLGAGYGDVITAHLAGYEATAVPTAGSVDNLIRLGAGAADVALASAADAADAYAGTGPFAGHPVAIRAIAQIYRDDLQVVVRTDRAIASVADLRGKRVATGPHGSGTESTATRVLAAAGLVPGRDVTTVTSSAAQSRDALIAGDIDALFWSGAVPSPIITDLLRSARGLVQLLPMDRVLDALTSRYGNAGYASAAIPSGAYGLPAGVRTISEPNVIVVGADLSDELSFELTLLLFQYQDDLVAVHPAAAAISLQTAGHTTPVPLASGAQRFYTAATRPASPGS